VAQLIGKDHVIDIGRFREIAALFTTTATEDEEVRQQFLALDREWPRSNMPNGCLPSPFCFNSPSSHYRAFFVPEHVSRRTDTAEC
jgi:hypothetical protein